jgi:hypothetical protein
MDQQFKYETQDMPTTYRPKSFATGTLLLTGVDLKTYRGIGGQFLCDITYKMKHFSALAPKTTTQPPPLPVVPAGSTYTPERGHNYILRWDHVTEQGGQKKFTYSYDLIMNDDNAMIYREKDFAELFRPI